MNDPVPPIYPPPSPAPAPRPPDPPPDPPNFWLMFGLGGFLVIASCGTCALVQSIIPFWIGSVVAFVSVFFQGYRGIFIGFVSTIGVILLAAAIVCGAIIVNMYQMNQHGVH